MPFVVSLPILVFPNLPTPARSHREGERVCACVCMHVCCVSVCISVCLSVCAPHSHKGYAAAVHQLPWDGCFMTRGWRLSSFGSNGRKCQSFSPSTARSAFVLFGCVLLFYSALKGPGTSLVCRPFEARSDARLIVSSTHARTHARTHASTTVSPVLQLCTEPAIVNGIVSTVENIKTVLRQSTNVSRNTLRALVTVRLCCFQSSTHRHTGTHKHTNTQTHRHTDTPPRMVSL